MTKDEAMKLALEALLHAYHEDEAHPKTLEVITAIDEALAQPEQKVDWEKLYRLEVKKKEALAAKYERDIKPLTKIVPMAQPEQEPVALVEKFSLLLWDYQELERAFEKVTGGKWIRKSNTPQRTWVGLTDEDKKQIAKEANYNWEMTTGEYAERIGRLTEANLKEKNT